MILPDNPCLTTQSFKQIVLRDKTHKGNSPSPTMRISNPNQKKVQILEVDNCAIKGDEKRCDYRIEVDQELSGFIELKGSDISYAIDQIKNSIRLLGFPTAEKKICFVICNRCPITSTEIQIFQKEFKKKFQSNLQVKEDGFTYKI